MKRNLGIALTCVTGAGMLALGFVGCEDAGDAPLAPLAPLNVGAGCDADVTPEGLPYEPGCCGYTVRIPEVEESGFDDGVVTSGGEPDHVHASFAGAPASGFVVNWRTNVETTATQVLYGTEEAAVRDAAEPSGSVALVTGHHLLYGSLLGSNGKTRVHEAHLCGLEPATTYYYKVGGPDGWSEVYDVATAPEEGATDTFRFAVTGDSRNEPGIWAAIQARVLDHGPDFQLFTGDAVALGANQDDWDAFFEAGDGSGFVVQDSLARVPFLVVNGNHDNLTVNFLAQFALPQELTEGEAAQGEEWWSFDYGNAHYIGLNDSPKASALGEAQLGWLREDLEAVDRDRTPWVFVFHHRSTYSCGGSHGSDLELRAAWQPIFDEHGVDVVFSGHDHLYERSRPMRGLDGTVGLPAEEEPSGAPVAGSGTLYVVTGGAGAPLYGADDTCEHTYTTESVRNYVIVDVEGRTLSYTAYRHPGDTVLDQLEYSK